MVSLIKKFIPRTHLVVKIYKTLRYFIRGCPSYWKFDILDAYANYKDDIKFVQIGSNSGMHDDPIYKYIRKNGWQGVLVEPVPYLFEELKNNYSGFEDKLFLKIAQ